MEFCLLKRKATSRAAVCTGGQAPWNFAYSNGRLYFSSRFVLDAEYMSAVCKLFRIDSDGTNLTHLTGYSPALPTLDERIVTSVIDIQVTDDGNIWILESLYGIRVDIPDDFIGSIRDLHDYWEHLDSQTKLRKLDNTGAEIRYIDLLSLLGNDYQIRSFALDFEGNIYIYAASPLDSGIYALNNDGAVAFNLDIFGWDNMLLHMQDGSVSVAGQTDTQPALSLTEINFSSETWGASMPLPTGTIRVFPSDGEFEALTSDGINLFGLNMDDGKAVALLNWMYSDIDFYSTSFVTVLPDGRIICFENTFLPGGSRTDIAVFTKTHYTDLAKRTELTLATFLLSHDIQTAVRLFNRSNHAYRVQIIEYFDPVSGDFYA